MRRCFFFRICVRFETKLCITKISIANISNMKLDLRFHLRCIFLKLFYLICKWIISITIVRLSLRRRQWIIHDRHIIHNHILTLDGKMDNERAANTGKKRAFNSIRSDDSNNWKLFFLAYLLYYCNFFCWILCFYTCTFSSTSTTHTVIGTRSFI